MVLNATGMDVTTWGESKGVGVSLEELWLLRDQVEEEESGKGDGEVERNVLRREYSVTKKWE